MKSNMQGKTALATGASSGIEEATARQLSREGLRTIVSTLPSQGTAAYAGTKAFLGAFSTALHRELHGSGVQVSVVLPGPVATELFDNSAHLEKGRRIPMEAAAIINRFSYHQTQGPISLFLNFEQEHKFIVGRQIIR